MYYLDIHHTIQQTTTWTRWVHLLFILSHIYIVSDQHIRLNNDLVSGRLLVLLAEDVNVPAGLVGHVRGVVAAAVLAELGDLGNLLAGELDLLEVLDNARGSDGLGDDRVAADLGPVEDDLGGGDGLAGALGGLLSDGLDVGVGDEKRNVEHVVSEGLDR